MSIPNLNLNQLYSVDGKVALVTGGGTGIGKMIAAALVANGAKGSKSLRIQFILLAESLKLLKNALQN